MPHLMLTSLLKLVRSQKEKQVALKAEEGLITLGDGAQLGGEGIRIASATDGQVQMTIDPNLMDILALPYRYTEDEISAAGYGKRINEALAEAEQLIEQAAKELSPLGVTPQHLRQLVQRLAKERAQGPNG